MNIYFDQCTAKVAMAMVIYQAKNISVTDNHIIFIIKNILSKLTVCVCMNVHRVKLMDEFPRKIVEVIRLKYHVTLHTLCYFIVRW